MARVEPIKFSFEMEYRISFNAAIRGHHIYKANWTPKLGEALTIKKDTREEALNYDVHALGVYRSNDILAGHVPIELSRILDFFIQSDEQNYVEARVSGKRKREVGLVVPAKYTAHTKSTRLASILHVELKKRKEALTHFEFSLETDEWNVKYPN